jgi:hypothetical protein
MTVNIRNILKICMRSRPTGAMTRPKNRGGSASYPPEFLNSRWYDHSGFGLEFDYELWLEDQERLKAQSPDTSVKSDDKPKDPDDDDIFWE